MQLNIYCEIKGDFEIIEGFLSALMQAMGYSSVRILALLESESNKDDSKSKRSLADLIVEDEQKNKYIIEIERSVQENFVSKALFNTSRLIVDNLAQGADYTKIMKVFHISILYFAVGNIALHHGKTVIKEIETQDKLTLHMKDPETNEEFDLTNIMPEYFFISVPMFNERIEKELDEWLYVMKHEQIPEKFTSKYMKKVKQKLEILKMSQTERYNYYWQKKVYSDRDQLEYAIARGRAEGRAEGRA